MKSQKKLELKKETIEILSQNSVRRIQGGCSKGEITVKKPTDGTCNNCFPTITCEPSVDVCPTKMQNVNQICIALNLHVQAPQYVATQHKQLIAGM